MMKYKAVIWDLDGTLLNTLEDLMNSVNYGLSGHGMPKISLEQTRMFRQMYLMILGNITVYIPKTKLNHMMVLWSL